MTPGQQLALVQLLDIAAKSKGSLEIIGEPHEPEDETHVIVSLSLATEEYRKDGGFKFRARERLRLYVHADFPFTAPHLYFGHKRFIGQPHVQWGSYICLYQSSETEYQPSDGLFGYFERVHDWMTAAGAGQLDPDEAPLHPPAVYETSPTRMIIKANAPPEIPDESFWIGRANLKKVRDHRFDVIGWTSLSDWNDHPEEPIAAAVLLKKPLAAEYPTKVYDLIKLVEGAGLSFGLLFRFLRLFSLHT